MVKYLFPFCEQIFFAKIVPWYFKAHFVLVDLSELLILVGELIEVLAPKELLGRTVVVFRACEILQKKKTIKY